MSKRAPDVSVLTGNRLWDGIVVYLAADGGWVESIEGALIARSADEARSLQAQGERDAVRNVVVEPYLAEVAVSGGRPMPARMRERVRVEGPSILGDVPGYVSPSAGTPSARATPNSSGAPLARGEGQGHTTTSTRLAAPHPRPSPGQGSNPVPASGERGSAEAA
jgi:Protein of unknown function (DUF2849)